ncbi:MAG: methionyl-tRNA formyltransferase [Candidatus Arsenophonus melophagi]|nr:methionyl-tRNA formyltransferase [Candidatus Arsenophonus melophagi]
MSESLRIIFAGTADFSAKHLIHLLSFPYKYKIVGILTKPDTSSGRGHKRISSPVKILAKKANIPVLQPISLKTTESQCWIENQHADVMVVVAYGMILPEIILNMLPMGCVNVHASLLPRWRGAAPIQHSILAGDQETGITIIQMDIGLDIGSMLYQVSCPIERKDTSATLYQKLAKLGPTALLHTLDLLVSDQVNPKKQNNTLASYAYKLSKKEALINWSLPAEQIERCIRAFNPWPVSYFTFLDQNLKVWHAETIVNTSNLEPGTIFCANKTGIQVITGKGILNILEIQPEGKKIMLSKDFLNSRIGLFFPGREIK